MSAEVVSVPAAAGSPEVADSFAITVYRPPVQPAAPELAGDTVQLTWQDAMHLPAERYPGITITSGTTAELESRISDLTTDIRRLRLAPIAGLVGLGVLGASLRYAPHVATNLSEHLERAGAEVAVFSGWGSLGAILFGSIMLHDASESRSAVKLDLKNINWLIDEGRVEPDTGAYFFKWPEGRQRRKYNKSLRA